MDGGGRVQVQPGGDDQGDDDGARVEGQDVLDPEDGKAPEGRNGVNRVLGARGGGDRISDTGRLAVGHTKGTLLGWDGHAGAP